jgi:hypothetical protein
MHRDWVPHAAEFLGSDIAGGARRRHRGRRAPPVGRRGEERFDVIISCSTFEHLKYPAVAAHEVLKALKVGGVLFVQTHQSFPLHGYPFDYFRFSREALAASSGPPWGSRSRPRTTTSRPRSSRAASRHAGHARLPEHDALGREALADPGRVPLRAAAGAGRVSAVAVSARRRVASNTALQLAGKGALLAMGAVSIAVLTRYLGPERYGQYTLALMYMQLFAVLADVGLFTTVVREISRDPSRTDELAGNALTRASCCRWG